MILGSSPRLWGCFSKKRGRKERPGVFPTLVGVFLEKARAKRTPRSLPHACGGVSAPFTTYHCPRWSSPRLWGCFHLHLFQQWSGNVFPTLVGVFPFTPIPITGSQRLPHACGGVSASIQLKGGKDESSPRLWGCFQEFRFRAPRALVFPTLVGVFPPDCSPGSLKHGLPHACGGVSFVKLRRCRAMSGRSRCPS